LQFQNSNWFKVAPSNIPDAGNGLFFSGRCEAGDPLCGYGGEVKDKHKGNYCAQLWGTGKIIDASCLKNYNNYRYATVLHLDFVLMQCAVGYL
jgi:hypothetical protein